MPSPGPGSKLLNLQLGTAHIILSRYVISGASNVLIL